MRRPIGEIIRNIVLSPQRGRNATRRGPWFKRTAIESSGWGTAIHDSIFPSPQLHNLFTIDCDTAPVER